MRHRDADKYYAVVCDVSPSEQLGLDPREVKVFASLIALSDPKAFDRVGSGHPDPNQRLELQKWSKSGWKYKNRFVDHALTIARADAPHVMAGCYVCDDAVVRHVGEFVFEKLAGAFPAPSSHSKKGRPRITLGGYRVDGVVVAPFEVLRDDLVMLGWYCESIASLVKSLVEVNQGERVGLDVLIDRLPKDPGDRVAVLLKDLVAKGTDGLGFLAGRPEKSDFMQRDLFADNLAGLRREIAVGSWTGSDEALEIFKVNRTVTAGDLPTWAPDSS